MIYVIFSVGLFVFFLTVYGTVVAGGLMLTKEQIETTPDLASEVGSDGSKRGISAADVARAEY
jgi:hypothetical protein